MHSRFARMWKPVAQRQQRGATVIEYALVAALIAIAVAAVMGPLGSAIGDKFEEAETTITGGGGGGGE